MRVLSDVQEMEVVVRYKLGMSTVRLGRMFGVDDTTIRRVLNRAGIPRRPRQLRSAVTPGTVRHLRDRGWSWQRIAAVTGISSTTARNRWEEGR